jgi:hypothetical protein
VKHPPADLPCPACEGPAFGAGAVVLCTVCDSYQHLACWTRAHRCTAAVKCKGKPQPVAVVRLEPPGPSAAEIADAVETRVQEIVHPLLADVRAAMAHGEDLEAFRSQAAKSFEETRARLESLRTEVEERAEKLRQVCAAIDARLAAAPPPVDRASLAALASEVREGADAGLRHASAALEGQLRELSRAMTAHMQGVILAVEACRWDTAARRQPLPWDERPEDVLAPRAAGGAQE